jgi:hypothetical protein
MSITYNDGSEYLGGYITVVKDGSNHKLRSGIGTMTWTKSSSSGEAFKYNYTYSYNGMWLNDAPQTDYNNYVQIKINGTLPSGVRIVYSDFYMWIDGKLKLVKVDTSETVETIVSFIIESIEKHLIPNKKEDSSGMTLKKEDSRTTGSTQPIDIPIKKPPPTTKAEWESGGGRFKSRKQKKRRKKQKRTKRRKLIR